MLNLVAAIGVTFFIGFVLVFLLLGGRSPESVRLMEVTAEARSAAVPKDIERGPAWLNADRIAKVLAPIRGILGPPKEAELTRLASAGYRKPSHADIFYAMKILLPIVAAFVTSLLMKRNVIFGILISAAIGFLLPDLWLLRAVAKRRDSIRLSLPDALDLMVICMEAGLGMDSAIVRVGQELEISHPELSDEFMLISLEQRAGKPRIEAWRAMAERTGVESVRGFVHMLVQTDRFGTPISRSLGAFADGLRTRRRQQAEEMAAKTTIKLIPPLVFFIFPSLFIVVLGPAILAISNNLSKVLGE